MIQADNLLEALQRADAFFRRFLPGDSCHFDQVGDSVYWQFSFPEKANKLFSDPSNFSMKEFMWPSGVLGHAISLWVWHRIAGWLVGCYIELERINIRAGRPDHIERYQKLFNAPIYYQQDSCGLLFPAHYLNYPIVQSAKSADQLMGTFPGELFHLEPEERSITYRVRAMVEHDLSRPFPTVEVIAKRLNVAVPTLHRHLKKEGNSYQKIKDECRCGVAMDYLRREEFSVKEVSGLLGFSDYSTFNRAFRKWTGMTPTEFRNSEH